MSSHTEINGKRYDRKILELAHELTSGSGDGRLAKADADKLFEAVKDGGRYSDIEKATIEYIREHYTWTDAADYWFRKEIRSWAATRQPSQSGEGHGTRVD